MLTKKKRSWDRVWLFLMLAAIGTVGCAPPGPHALLKGKRLLEEGKFTEAIKELKLATSLMSTNAQAWNYLGLACHEGGQPAVAAEAYGKALKLNHDLVIAHYNLGCLFLEQNHLEAAKSELIAFNLLQRDSLDGYLKLGAVQLRLRDFGGAEKTFAEANRLSPQNAEVLNDLGIVQIERNRPRDAAGYFNAALKERPDYGPSLLNLAIVSHEYLNNRPLALQKYQEYLASAPHDANWEKVSATAHDLDADSNPPSRPISSNPAPPANFIASRSAVTVNTNVTRTNTVIPAAPKPANPAPAQTNVPPPALKPEVVRLPDAQPVKVAASVTSVPKASPAAATEPTVVDPPSDAVVAAQPDKRGLLQKMNPLNLFRHEPKPVPNPTPLPATTDLPGDSTKVAVVSTEAKPVSTSAAVTARPAPPAHYPYASPPKPAPGDRIKAQQLFAEGVQAQRDRRFRDAETLYRAATQADPGFFEAQSNLGLAAYDQGDLAQSLLAYETALAINPASFSARFNFALALKKANYIQDAAVELEKLVAPGQTPESPARLALAHLTVANLYAEQFHQFTAARSHYTKVIELDPQNPQATAIRYWLKDHR